MSDPRRIHLAYLDGIRGWAAVFVAIHHCWGHVATRANIPPAPRWFTIFIPFKYGTVAVAVFIVLSGYCLMIPAARSPTLELPGGVLQFIKRRARRILAPYYAALVLALGLAAALPRMAHVTPPTFTVENLAAHALLVHNWFEHLQWTIDPPMWSIAAEWQIYFVFALALLPVFRRFGLLVTVPVGFLIGAVPMLTGHWFIFPWYVGLFSIGLAAAAVNIMPRYAGLMLNPIALERWSIGLWVLAWGITLAKIKALGWQHPLPDTLIGLATATFLLASTERYKQGMTPSFVVRFLEHPVSAKLGEFSYSTYLVHGPVLAVFDLPLVDRAITIVPSFFFLVLVAVPAALVASYAFHRAFERPFMSQKGLMIQAHTPALAADVALGPRQSKI